MVAFLSVRHLTVSFQNEQGRYVALKDISFDLNAHDRLVILGESGSGKSTLVNTLMGLLPQHARIESGIVYFKGQMIDLTTKEVAKKGLSDLDVSLMFQDAKASLNPELTIYDQFKDYLLWHQLCRKDQVRSFATVSLESLGFTDPERILKAYPHELSGGMAQRVAMALLSIQSSDGLLIADEPTSALDVANGDKLLALLRDKLHQTQLMITHDLRVAKALATHILVLYQGRVQEIGRVEDVLYHPQSAYTATLMKENERMNQLTPPKLAEVSSTLLQVQGLTQSYNEVAVLNDVNFTIAQGEIVGLLGPSGSGKSTIARSIMGLTNPEQGHIIYEGQDLLTMTRRQRRQLAPQIQMIFQHPRASLNPRYKVFDQVQEVLMNSRRYTKQEMRQRSMTYLKRVGLDEHLWYKRPPELSTGQCQRVAIVRAIVSHPKLLICDEAVASLDQMIQGHVLSLLLELKEELNLSILMISHDPRILNGLCHRILPLEQGSLST